MGPVEPSLLSNQFIRVLRQARRFDVYAAGLQHGRIGAATERTLLNSLVIYELSDERATVASFVLRVVPRQ
jgi:hypothetical protein